MVDGLTPVSLLYVALPLATILVGAAILYWLRTRLWDRQGVRWYAVVVLAGQAWMALLLVHLLVTDPALQRPVLVAETVVGFSTFMAWVVFVSVYTDAGYHRSRLVQASMAAFVGGYLALAVSNPWHQFLYADRPVFSGPLTYVGPEVNVGFVLVAIVGLVPIGYSLYVLLVYLVTTQRHSGVRILFTLLGVLSISLAEALGELGAFPAVGLHHAAYGVLPFYLLVTFTLFRLHLFDVQPVARNAVVEALDDPIVLVDEHHRLVDYNAAAAGRWPAVSNRVGEPLDRALPALDESIEVPTGRTETTDRIVLGDDGTDRHYSVTISPITRGDDDAVGWHAIILRDVTDIERSRRELERQNDRLDQVASTISHDLRNPIQVAAGHADLLDGELERLAEAASGDPDEVAETLTEGRSHLSETDHSLDRMEEIIDDVLTLAREGRTVESTDPLQLATVAREAWSNVDTGDADLVVAVDDDRTLEADQSRLLSIFENLFRNAMEHAGSGVTVTVESTGDGFAVTDDGPGIPPDRREEVFQYGYTSESDGTGLGLAIVRTMADSHDWTVSIDDASDDGTRFVFDCRGSAATPEPAARTGTFD